MTKGSCERFVQSQRYPGFSYEKYGCIICGNYRTETLQFEENEEHDIPACAENHPQITVAWRTFKEKEP